MDIFGGQRWRIVLVDNFGDILVDSLVDSSIGQFWWTVLVDSFGGQFG